MARTTLCRGDSSVPRVVPDRGKRDRHALLLGTDEIRYRMTHPALYVPVRAQSYRAHVGHPLRRKGKLTG